MFKSQIEKLCDPGEEYDDVRQNIYSALMLCDTEGMSEKEILMHKIDFIKYIIRLMRIEMGCGAERYIRSEVMYRNDIKLPVYYIDENGRKKSFIYTGNEKRKVDIGPDTISIPLSLKKMFNLFVRLKGKEWMDFSPPRDHRGMYIEELEMLIIKEGHHSTATFVNLGQPGFVNADVVSIKLLLDLYEEGRVVWKDVDKRFVVLFELAIVLRALNEALKKHNDEEA